MRRRRRRLWAVLVVAVAVVLVLIMPGHRSAARSAPRFPPTADPRPVASGQFSPGACVTMAPLAGNRHLSVFIDAGHGGVDPGGVGTTESGQQVEEADLTLPVELDAANELRRDGFAVTVSRTGATNVARLGPADVGGGALTVQGAHDDVAARAVCANLAGAQLLVGIYFDAGTSSSNAGSVTGYDAVRPFSAANLRFAQLLQSDVLSAMNAQGWAIPDEGVLTDDSLGSSSSSAATAYGHLMLLGPAETGYFTTPSQMPGALIEPLFITDPFEASIAASSQGQEVIAGGIARAVEQYFGVP
jgi:N-acetylmuramoyl-L-alanine amidase